MKKGINKVILVGNLGKDPETKYLPNGSAVTNITLATSESWKDKNTGQPQERTEWHRVVFFNKLAEIAGQYLKKGAKVYVEGKLQTRTYDKDGQKHYATEILGDEMQMLDAKGNESGKTHKADQPAAQPAAGGGGAGDFDDDIPFARLTSNYSF